MDENTILSGLTYDAEGGALTFNGVRYFLIRPETLIEFQKAVAAEVGVDKCSELIYRGGFAGGALSARKYRAVFSKTDRETAAYLCAMGSQIGWGRFELTQFDPDARAVRVTVTGSAFAAVYGASNVPVCHFIRGVVGGMTSVVLDSEVVRVTEESCSALVGADVCAFLAHA